jgi:release factor H-coupled RctB family protein
VVIPGSRGTLSYLVIATGDQDQNLATLAHGAGRKWKRYECRGRLEKKYSKESLLRTEFGGYVLCSDKHLLYEEAPQAYKDVDIVVQDLVDAGLVKITYKTRVIKR